MFIKLIFFESHWKQVFEEIQAFLNEKIMGTEALGSDIWGLFLW